MLKGLGFLALVATISLLASGCTVTTPPEVGASVYVRGQGKISLPHNVETVFNAAVAALEQDMLLQVHDKAFDLTTGRIDAKRADSNKVKVRLYYRAADLTELRVRVGTVGDNTWTQIFFEKLEARLPQ